MECQIRAELAQKVRVVGKHPGPRQDALPLPTPQPKVVLEALVVGLPRKATPHPGPVIVDEWVRGCKNYRCLPTVWPFGHAPQ